jgi:demethoxyubiquinone hydroxylase (CLK1/Coq7/Cat5 family)
MQLNFLGKAFIAATTALIGVKVAESLTEEVQHVIPTLYTGQELLNMLDSHSLSFFKLAARNRNWEQFNKMVDASEVRRAVYEQRCEMWELCQS